MSRPNYDVTTTADGIEITAEREKLFQLRNGVFAAYFDARFPENEGTRLRSAVIPEPNGTLREATFVVAPNDATLIADALNEAARVAEDDDRDATGRRLRRDADALRFAVGAYDGADTDRAASAD